MYTSPVKKTNPAASRAAELGEKNGRTLPAVPVLQNKPVQKMEVEEEELPLQGKFTVQKKELEEELPLQGKFNSAETAQEQQKAVQRFTSETPFIQKKENNTGLPDNLKEGVENLAGFAIDDVKVHYNSDKPAQLNALAYAQGTDIHVGPGQEKHLPHEAWHMVQQKQGRVKPTMQMKEGVAVNDDRGLENEADVMGAKALQMISAPVKLMGTSMANAPAGTFQLKEAVIQMRLGHLDQTRVTDGQQIPLNHNDYGGLKDGYKGLHVTLLPKSRRNDNSVHITGYELPNPGAGGLRTYKWYNPLTGAWQAWTNGSPLTDPMQDPALQTFVSNLIDFYLEPVSVEQAPLTPNAFPDLFAKSPKEIEREQRAKAQRLKVEAAKAEKQRLIKEKREKELQAGKEAQERKALAAKEKQMKEQAEMEAKAAVAELERLKRLREQQEIEYAEDIALGMELADMYGWSESIVFEMAIANEFRDQVEARKGLKETPSYIS